MDAMPVIEFAPKYPDLNAFSTDDNSAVIICIHIAMFVLKYTYTDNSENEAGNVNFVLPFVSPRNFHSDNLVFCIFSFSSLRKT